MSRSNRTVTTLQDLEDDKILVSTNKYKKIIDQIKDLEDNLNIMTENNSLSELENEYLKTEINNL